MSTPSPPASRRTRPRPSPAPSRPSTPASATSRPGLNVEDQLFRQTLGLPDTAQRMQAFMDLGGQTRAVELGESPF